MSTEAATKHPGLSLSDRFQDEARPLIDFIDGLRHLGIDQDLPIPQIAVMGDQSSGKSSVLEALSGIPFPRGSGLVTRCATQIAMFKSSKWKASVSIRRKETGKLDSKIQGVQTPEELGSKISELTDTLCGAPTDGSFSQDVIEVTLGAPDAPDLTIIDLPGIVRTTTSGQDKSMIQEVDSLLNKYLVQDRTIILAVIPCNVDIATVDILERAQKVDPKGVRTLGVLTKPDLIDEGGEDEVLEVLKNHRKPLKLGYTCVKNRSQKELSAKQSLKEAREAEQRFFASHPVLSKASSDLLGVQSLTTRLTELLVNHIRRVLPDLFNDIEKMLAATRQDLSAMGKPPAGDTHTQREEVFRVRENAGKLLRTEVRCGTIVVSMQRALEKFGTDIRESRPDFEESNTAYNVRVEFRAGNSTFNFRCTLKANDIGAKEPGEALRHGSEVKLLAKDQPIEHRCQLFKGDRPVGSPGKLTWSATTQGLATWEGYSRSEGDTVPPQGTGRLPGRKFSAGDDVECRYKGEITWYKGKVSNVCLDGSYEVTYDDGDVECGVATDLIRPAPTPESPHCTYTIYCNRGNLNSNGCGRCQIIDTAVGGASFREKVRCLIAENRGRPLPGFLDYDVFTKLAQQFIDKWRGPTWKLMKAVRLVVADTLEKIASSTAYKACYPALYQRVAFASKSAVDTASQQVLASVKRAFERERMPSTRNHYLMDTVNKLRAKRLSKAMASAFAPSASYTGTQATEIVNAWFRNSQAIGNASDGEQEAQDMVDILKAYYTVALKRFIDNMQQIIDQDLVCALPHLCGDAMRKVFVGASDGELALLFAVPKNDARRHADLQQKFKRLSQAQAQCATLVSGHRATVICCANEASQKRSRSQPTNCTADVFLSKEGEGSWLAGADGL